MTQLARRISLFFGLLVLGSSSFAESKISAQDLDQIFERGGKRIEFAFRTQLQIPRLSTMTQRASESPTTPRLKTGGYIAPQVPRIKESQAYRSGKAVFSDPRFQKLEPSRQEAARINWETLLDERGERLETAYELDADDSALIREGDKIDIDAGKLNKEQDQLNIDIGQFNRDCTGRQLPPNEYQLCMNRRAVLEHRKTDLGRRISDHNAGVSDFNRRVGELRDRASSQEAGVSRWESSIKEFIRRMEEEFDGKEYESCRYQEARDGQGRCLYQCTRSGLCWLHANDLGQCKPIREMPVPACPPPSFERETGGFTGKSGD